MKFSLKTRRISGFSVSSRRMRGGSWSGRLDALRIDRADDYPPELRGGAIGFRVVLAPVLAPEG